MSPNISPRPFEFKIEWDYELKTLQRQPAEATHVIIRNTILARPPHVFHTMLTLDDKGMLVLQRLREPSSASLNRVPEKRKLTMELPSNETGFPTGTL